MDKNLQDLAWSVLPKEFKEEVKKEYLVHHEEGGDMKYSYGYSDALTDFFGLHNLTSNTEGHDEMVTISRKELQKQYQMYKQLGCLKRLDALMRLFGSKCLPDEKIDLERLVNTIKESIEEPLPDKMLLDGMAEQKPAEPKYHIGQYVRHKPTRLVDVIEGISQSAPYIYHFKHMVNPINGQGIFESDLEPYAELTENLKPSNSGDLESQKTCTQTFTDDTSTFTDNRQSQCKSQSRNLSQETANCDTHSNNSLTDKKNGGVDHFVVERDMVKGRRLNIATQITKALIQGVNFLYAWSNDEIKDVAHNSMRFADALIAEAEKGDKYGED